MAYIGGNIINNIKIKRIRLDDEQKIPKAFDMYDSICGNLLIVAKKNSGKTTLIYNILKRKTDKDTTIIYFSSTIYNDKLVIKMKNVFEAKNIVFLTYTDIIDEKGENHLKNLIELIQQEKKEEEELKQKEIERKLKKKEEQEKQNLFLNLQMIEEVKEENEDEPLWKEPRKKKFYSPKYILVFDDISNMLKDRYIIKLLKESRHYGIFMVLSTQFTKDILPQQFNQFDWIHLFGYINEKNLEHIHTNLGLGISLDDFIKLYNDATKKKFNFLYIERNKDEYRRNFDFKYIIQKNKI